MKKLLLLLPFFLLGCKEDPLFIYEVRVERCNGKIDTVEFTAHTDPYIATYNRAVPILVVDDRTNGNHIVNVCDFKRLRKY